nr:thiopeptide-type bacteriocin biosynthesis protein [Streptomyces sp. A0958]
MASLLLRGGTNRHQSLSKSDRLLDNSPPPRAGQGIRTVTQQTELGRFDLVFTWWAESTAATVPAWVRSATPSPGPGSALKDRAGVRRGTLDSGSCGVTANWHPALYEPETIAFGGPAGLAFAHALFHADSEGVLNYNRAYEARPTDQLGPKETSLLAMALLMRATRLEIGEQGDAWGRVEEGRPLPDDVTPQQVSAMTAPLKGLLLTDARPLLTDGPLTPVRPWIEALQQHGHRLAEAAESSELSTGKRAILALHILFHWNRMGFSVGPRVQPGTRWIAGGLGQGGGAPRRASPPPDHTTPRPSVQTRREYLRGPVGTLGGRAAVLGPVFKLPSSPEGRPGGVRCFPKFSASLEQGRPHSSACRPQASVLDVPGSGTGAARVRAWRRPADGSLKTGPRRVVPIVGCLPGDVERAPKIVV